jgi:hypothetical protein
LTTTHLSQANRADLAEGATTGAILYLRMVDWALALETTSLPEL